MKKIPFLGLTLFIVLFGCDKNSEMARAPAEEAGIVAVTEEKNIETAERKLIKEGDVSFETSDIAATRQTIFQAVKKFDAYVSSDKESKSPGRNTNTIVIRVPSTHFDALLTEATSGIENFDSKNIGVEDVTEEFLDIQARLKTKKELENRFLELLKKAQTVTEILEIEKQIGELRAEIESIEGRLKYLQDRVSYSSLTLTFYETLSSETEFGRKFKSGFRNGWDGLIWFLVLITNLWAFIVLGLGLFIGIKFYRRRKKQNTSQHS